MGKRCSVDSRDSIFTGIGVDVIAAILGISILVSIFGTVLYCYLFLVPK